MELVPVVAVILLYSIAVSGKFVYEKLLSEVFFNFYLKTRDSVKLYNRYRNSNEKYKALKNKRK